MKKKLELVFIPVPGVGHIFSAIGVAELLAAQNEDLSITILLMEWLNITNPILKSSHHPQLRFIELRKEEYPSQNNPSTFYFEFIDSHKNHVREILSEIAGSGRTHLAGIVADMMCMTMLDLADEFKLPSYVFFPSCASFLGLMFHLQGLRDESNINVTEFKDSGKVIAVPAYMNAVPDTALPSLFLEKGGGSNACLDLAKRFREAKGILINTFSDLETHAIRSLVEDESIPPVYPIGPIIKLDGIFSDRSEESEEIMKWMDFQPDCSVLFLCFGSMGFFPANQVKEIAAALEKTGFRFIWSLRKPNSKIGFVPEIGYEDLNDVLPVGFLQRTAEAGKVIGWAPQAAVLGHPAMAGFVTHCGWNSVLESVWNGVPMATWPVYSEQQLNAFLLVKELGLAEEIKMDYRTENVGIVSAEVIENGLRKLMNSENEIRKKMKELKEKSRLAIMEGGSSFASLSCFLDIVRENVLTC